MKSSNTVSRGALALLATLATAGCGLDSDVGSRQQNMGMDWGGGDTEVIDSDLPDPTVALLGEITHPDMVAPTRIAAAPDGTIAVSDLTARSVFVFTPNGALKHAIPVAYPLGVTADGDGRIYVGDFASGSVQIFDGAGVYVGALGAGAGELDKPTDLAWDPSANRILVADANADRVRVFATTGAPLFDFGVTGAAPGQFQFPNGVAVDDAGGRYFVVDNQNSRIQVFDRDGAFLSEFGEYGSDKKQFNRPAGLAIDPLGRIYVTDNFQSTLQVVDDAGLHVSYLGEAGSMYGQLRLTTDAVVDPFNRLLVTSYKTAKVVVYGIDEFATPPPDIVALAATAWLDPGAIVQKSRAPWASLYIELPGGDVTTVPPDSVRVQGLARAPGSPTAIGDHDEDGVPDLMIKISLPDLFTALAGPGSYTLAVTGEHDTDGIFEGDAAFTVLEVGP